MQAGQIILCILRFSFLLYLLFSCLPEMKPQLHRRSFSGLTFDAHSSVHQIRRLLYNRQAKSRACSAAD